MQADRNLVYALDRSTNIYLLSKLAKFYSLMKLYDKIYLKGKDSIYLFI